MRWKDNRIKEEMEEEIVCKLWTQEPTIFSPLKIIPEKIVITAPKERT